MFTALMLIKLYSHVSITHLGSLKAHMLLKAVGKAINTNSELNSSYSCITALYER